MSVSLIKIGLLVGLLEKCSFISTVKDMPIKRLEHNIDEKKKKTTNSVEEFQKVSKALCHTGEFYKN